MNSLTYLLTFKERCWPRASVYSFFQRLKRATEAERTPSEYGRLDNRRPVCHSDLDYQRCCQTSFQLTVIAG